MKQLCFLICLFFRSSCYFAATGFPDYKFCIQPDRFHWSACTDIYCLFYRYLPFSLEIRQAMAVIALAPSSSLALIFTMKLKGDVIMAGNICSLSILLSTIAMTILLVYL